MGRLAMPVIVSVMLMLMLVVGFGAAGHGEDGEEETCTSATLTCACGSPRAAPTQSQGPPGKRGPQGEPGPQGQKGNPGTTEALELEMRKLREETHRKIRALNGKDCWAGMASGQIEDDQIHASSYWGQGTSNQGHHPDQARLDQSTHGWASLDLVTEREWIGVDFREPRLIQGVILQGRPLLYPQWITSFKILYGDDASDLQYVGEDGTQTVFAGNTNRDSHRRVIFEREIRARLLRIEPVTWYSHRTLRFEILSCT